MNLTSAQNVQNRGTFQAANTALRSGNSSSDRQSGGETYMPYQHGDQVRFQTAHFHAQPEIPQANGIALWIERLLNLDMRVYTSLIATLLFSTLFNALTASALWTIVVSVPFFLVWYVMSFFNYQRLYQNSLGHAPMKHTSHQVPATF